MKELDEAIDAIEVIEKDTGSKCPIDVKKIDDRTIEVTFGEGLKKGHDYYMIISDFGKESKGDKKNKAVFKVKY